MQAVSSLSSLRHLLATLLAVGATFCAPAVQAGNANVGVSISIDQPGFYGRINIGEQAPPPLIYQQPVIIQQTPVGMHQRPIYLHVPPGHYKKWSRYCGRYNACGQRVYFVQDRWAREHHGRPGGKHRGDRYDRHDRHDHDRGRGRDHDHHHGRGH